MGSRLGSRIGSVVALAALVVGAGQSSARAGLQPVAAAATVGTGSTLPGLSLTPSWQTVKFTAKVLGTLGLTEGLHAGLAVGVVDCSFEGGGTMAEDVVTGAGEGALSCTDMADAAVYAGTQWLPDYASVDISCPTFKYTRVGSVVTSGGQCNVCLGEHNVGCETGSGRIDAVFLVEALDFPVTSFALEGVAEANQIQT